jgi:REP element-mobilizing transposase RayT
MAQSLSQLYVHIIFHVKGESMIDVHDKEKLYAYIGGVITRTGSIPIRINGMPDHIHILCALSKNISLATLVKEIKTSSSKWIKGLTPRYAGFEWQRGYAAFSVSQSVREATIIYITNQAEHHRKFSFREEYLAFLKEYGVEYDEEYLWSE